jgi:hypothetical protein
MPLYKSDFMHSFCKPSVDVRTHHLYVMEKGHPEWQAHIAFRDHLRDHPETAEAYDAAQRISLHRHIQAFERYVKPRDRVLEIGAGPGRFTIELASLGASVTVTDISPAQLELNHTHVTDAGLAGSVAEWAVADVTNPCPLLGRCLRRKRRSWRPVELRARPARDRGCRDAPGHENQAATSSLV